jgi:tetratricopeptide (TPR) repeat protein
MTDYEFSSKALLVCEIINEAELLEQLGDIECCKVIAKHNSLARDLQKKYRTIEADRTDGFLLLFESPINAVLYALDLQAATLELSHMEGIELQLGIGIHYGEVIQIAGPPDKISREDRPIVIEGLAKPVAARIMSLARGGQILLSKPSFSLVGDLLNQKDKRGIYGKVLGKYRLKGISEAIEIFEVGVHRQASPRTPRRMHRVKMMGFGILAVLGLIVIIALGWLRSGQNSPRTAAILSMKNIGGHSEYEWLSIGLAELLRSYIAMDGSMRTVRGDRVAEVERDFSCIPLKNLTPKEREIMRLNLGVDILIDGRYEVIEEDKLLRVTLLIEEADSDEIIGLKTRTGVVYQPADLIRIIDDTLRTQLGISELTSQQQQEAEASFPSGVEAGRLYAEGLASLWKREFDKARQKFSSAVAAEPTHPMPYVYLSDALLELSYREESLKAIEAALKHADMISDRQRMLIEARWHVVERDWMRAISIYQNIYESYPDDLDAGFDLAICQIYAERIDGALATLDDIERLHEASDNPRVNLIRAWAWETIGEPEKQLHSARDAVHQARTRRASHMVAKALLTEARALVELGETEKVDDEPDVGAKLDEAIRIFQNAGDHEGVADAYFCKAQAITLDDFDSANEYFAAALDIYRHSGNRKSEAQVMISLGRLLFYYGRLEEAIELYSNATTMLERSGIEAHHERASCLANLGAIFQEQGNLAEARMRYTAALEVFQDIGNEELEIAIVLTNIGEIYYLELDLDSAQQMHQEALRINETFEDQVGIAYDNYRLGMILVAQGQWAAARQHYQLALSLQESGKVEAADASLALAELELIEGNCTRAEELARNAEKMLLSEGLNDKGALAQALIIEALLGRGMVNETGVYVERAKLAAKDIEDPHLLFLIEVATAKVQAARGEIDIALAKLEDAIKRAYDLDILEARLVMGAIELGAGRVDKARSRLTKLSIEAQARGATGITKRVEELLASHGTR